MKKGFLPSSFKRFNSSILSRLNYRIRLEKSSDTDTFPPLNILSFFNLAMQALRTSSLATYEEKAMCKILGLTLSDSDPYLDPLVVGVRWHLSMLQLEDCTPTKLEMKSRTTSRQFSFAFSVTPCKIRLFLLPLFSKSSSLRRRSSFSFLSFFIPATTVST